MIALDTNLLVSLFPKLRTRNPLVNK